MRRVALLAAALVALGACGNDGAVTATSSPGTTTTIAPSTTTSAPESVTTTAPSTTAASDALPPHDFDPLVEIFDPIVRPLGYELTRGALIDRDTYEVDPEGGHLALYLAPLEDVSFDTYAADFPRIAEALIPMVFARWPGLESFDVCQEQYGFTGGTPPSLTIVDLTAEAAAQVSWEGLDLETLIGYGNAVEDIAVWARNGVKESETWRSAATG